MLSKNAILEYQEIHKREFEEEITYEQALEQGTKLLRLFQLIFKPIPKNWLKDKKEEAK